MSLSLRGGDTPLRKPSRSASLRSGNTPLRKPSRTVSMSPTVSAGSKRPMKSDDSDEDDQSCTPTPKRVKKEDSIENPYQSSDSESEDEERLQDATEDERDIASINLPRSNILEYRRSSNSQLALLKTSSDGSNSDVDQDSSSDSSESRGEKQTALQDIMDTAQAKIEEKHKLALKIRKERAKLWNTVEDCEDSIQVEERCIYRGRGNPDLSLELLEVLKSKRIKSLQKMGTKMRQLERCYEAIAEAQQEYLEAKANLEDL